MKMKTDKIESGLPTPGSWVCPHCYCREPLNRILLRTGQEIPQEQDRRWYWHMERTVGLKNAPLPQKLADWRLLSSGQVEWKNGNVHLKNEGGEDHGRVCIHCHMPVAEVLMGAEFARVLSNCGELTEDFLRSLDHQECEDAGQDPLTLPLEQFRLARRGLTRDVVIRYEGGSLWLAAHNKELELKDKAYGQQLWDRQCLSANGYVILLRLDQDGEDESACLLLERILDLHGGPERIRQKSAAVIAILPQGQTQENLADHVRVLKLLELMLRKCELIVPENNRIDEETGKIAVDRLAELRNLLKVQPLQADTAPEQALPEKQMDGAQEGQPSEQVSYEDEFDGTTGG